jgi:hypothetical protein
MARFDSLDRNHFLAAAGTAQRAESAPSDGVVGSLDQALGGRFEPVQHHAVDGRWRPEVDPDPLLAQPGGAPGTAEVVRPADP